MQFLEKEQQTVLVSWNITIPQRISLFATRQKRVRVCLSDKKGINVSLVDLEE